MRPLTLACAFAGVSFASTAGDAALKPLSFRAEARVEVDERGKLVKIEASQDLPAPVRAYIERQLATWTYTRHARTAGIGNAATWVQLGACAVPKSDGTYAMGLAFHGSGPRIAEGGKWKIPGDLPAAVGRSGAQGSALVHFVVNADGSATMESMESTTLRDPRTRRAIEPALASFIAVNHFDPEQVGGKPVATRETVPMEFRVTGGRPSHAQLLADAMTSPQCKIAELMASDAMQPGMQAVAVDSVIAIQPKI